LIISPKWLWIEGIAETKVFSASRGTVIWERDPARDMALDHLAARASSSCRGSSMPCHTSSRRVSENSGQI